MDGETISYILCKHCKLKDTAGCYCSAYDRWNNEWYTNRDIILCGKGLEREDK